MRATLLALWLCGAAAAATAEATPATSPGAAATAPDAPPLPAPLREALATAPAEATALAAWLRHSRDPRLRADAAFARLHALLPDLPRRRADAFAAALAEHVADPALRCRRPLFTHYLARRYGDAPAAACRGEVPFRVLSLLEGSGLRWLDPARVRAIHLLHGGPDDALASRFGHVGLRLVVCPTPEASDEACATNVREHLVLGYRAHVDEIALRIGKALTGGYAMHFYAQPFLDVYREYAIDEFRTVYSLPLALPAPELPGVVRELAELHFRAAGPYRYVTRNCATRLQQALRVVWPAYAGEPALRWLRLRPDSLFAGLRDSRAVLPGALADRARAEHDGHLFPSTRPYYERAAAQVGASLPGAGFTTLEGFLRQAPRARAAARAAAPAYAAALRRDRQLYEAQLLLEEYAMLWSGRRLLAEIGERFARLPPAALEQRLRERVPGADAAVIRSCVLEPLQQRGRPAVLRELPLRGNTAAATPGDCAGAAATAAIGRHLDRFLADDTPASRELRRLADYHGQSLVNLAALRGLRAD